MRIVRHIRVTGRVQGVFFRQSAVEKARALAIAGWVRNRSDGSVEAHVEGEPDAVEAMLAWLRRGPAHASVEQVQIEEVPTRDSNRFEIRRS